MAKPRTCCSLQNYLLLNSKNELIGGIPGALINGSGIVFSISAAFYASILTLSLILGLLGLYININLQRIIKLILKLFIRGKKHSQANFVLQNRAFKAKN